VSQSDIKPQAATPALSAPAPKTAKLFKNGRSQAVRLPKEFRFEGDEVAIRRDEATGEVAKAPAAQALALGLTLVIHDRVFSFVDGLKTEDWTV